MSEIVNSRKKIVFYIRELEKINKHSESKEKTMKKSSNASRRDNLVIGKSYLTPKETDCVKEILKNGTLKETAEVLGLSVRTIDFYVKNVRRKFSLRNKKELIGYFRCLNII